jgi:hypothetical protein
MTGRAKRRLAAEASSAAKVWAIDGFHRNKMLAHKHVEIGRDLLSNEATITRRIVRAKRGPDAIRTHYLCRRHSRSIRHTNEPKALHLAFHAPF